MLQESFAPIICHVYMILLYKKETNNISPYSRVVVVIVMSETKKSKTFTYKFHA